MNLSSFRKRQGYHDDMNINPSTGRAALVEMHLKIQFIWS